MINVSHIFLAIVAVAAATFFLSSNRRMAALVVLAAFATRPFLDVGSFTLRPEMLVGGLACLRLVHDGLGRRSQKLSNGVRWSLSLTLAWLIFALVTSLNVPPYPQRSMTVLVWCALNVITAVWIAKTPSSWYWLLRWGTMAALSCSVLAIVFWLGATAGVFIFGVQVDPTYGGYAAYVFSLEANILAGLLCLWTLVAVVNPMGAVPQWIRVALAFSAPMAILTTHTRAALVAYLVGLLACVLLRPAVRRVALASLGFGGMGGLFLLLSGGDAGFSKFLDVFDINEGTGGLRNKVGSVALAEWWASPERMIGLGWNSFGQRHIDETQPALLLPGYIGNLPVQILYDSGIIGGLLAFFAVAAAALSVHRVGRFDRLIIFLLPYLLFSIATMVLWLLETWLFVGLAWGLCAKYDRAQRSSASGVNLSYLGRRTGMIENAP